MELKLRDYQEEALDAVVAAERGGIRKQLVVLPTGAGKTVIFSHLPVHRADSLPMLVLAHREELLVQAKEKILKANPHLKVGIEQAENYADEDSDVVCASVATLGRADSSRIERFARSYFQAVVVDEAHHAAAPTYRRVLDYFSDALHLGVTATPQRGDNVRLTDVFDKIVYYKTIKEMIQDGWLCDLLGYRIHSSTSIEHVATARGDYVESQLADAINNPIRNQLVVDTYRSKLNDRRTLVFAADVAHAEALLNTFRADGVDAALVVGTTPSDLRGDIRASFKSGSTKVLINVGVFTEGFDEPLVEGIILARPTKSALLYTQIVGRGTRTADGKHHCIVIDIADVTKGKKPIGLPTLMGLPPDFDADGESLIEISNRFEELEQLAPGEAARVKSLDDIEGAFERVDLFMPPPPSEIVVEYSQLIWAEIGNDNYFLRLSADESLNISRDALGILVVTLHSKKEGVRLLGRVETIQEAFNRTDAWIVANREENMKFLNADAAWRGDPPTDKQIKWLNKHGVPITEDMTKGVASQILDKIFADNPKPKRPAWLEAKIAQQKAAKSGPFPF